MDPQKQALQSAHEILSEHFPHVIVAVEAQGVGPNGKPTHNQLLRWYGDSTTATGLILYASDLFSRRFGEPPQAPAPETVPPIKPPQEDALAKSQAILTEHFPVTIIVAQGEGEFSGRVERSLKTIRWSGNATTVSGLALFASNALRKMAVGG